MKSVLFVILTLMIIQSCNDIENRTQTTTKKFFNSDNPNMPDFKTEAQTDFVEVFSSNGKEIYESNCSSCHTKFKDDYTLGNSQITKDLKYLKNYLNNQDSLILLKDPLTLAIKKEWGNKKFTHRFNLSNSEIESIRDYMLK